MRQRRGLYRKGASFRNLLGLLVLQRLYLDHAATTPICDAARAAVAHAFDIWANPSSPHAEGRAARAALEDARARIAAALDWRHDIVFTSGASEAIAMALQRSRTDAILTTTVEHDAVHRSAPNAFVVPVAASGLVTPDALYGRLSALAADRPLVAIQHANNETGVLQPLDALAEITHAKNGLFFADCAQTAGKLPLPDADLIAVSAHKFGGPPGIGALLVRDLAMLTPSGGQEKGYRGGTENLPGILGFAAALDTGHGWVARAEDLRQHLDAAIDAAGGAVVCKDSPRLATIASYRMPGKASSAQLIQFDLAGIAVSAGSACSSGTLKASRILAALGWDDKAAAEVIRVSFGPETSRADIYRFVETWQRIRG